jgi:hypothetical protein
VEYEQSLLPRARDFVYAIDEHFQNPHAGEQVKYNNMNVFDLVSTFYPGPRRFEKYRQGLGAGQVGQERLMKKK